MTLYLLKVHLHTFLSIPITQKCQILSCDTLVANERYIYMYVCVRVRVCFLQFSRKFHIEASTSRYF